MAQLSRPYQIGLVAIALLAAAWLVLIQGHHSSPSESSSAPAPATHPAQSPSAAAKAHAQGSAGKATGHGSASSLGALGHDVEKARGAVATTKANAQELQRKSSQASSQNPSSSSSSSHASTSAGAGATTHSAAPSTSATHAAPKSSSPAKGTVRAAVAVRQHAVEAQLAHGKTVLIFFWNPKGSDDRAVNQALGKLPNDLNIAIDRARSNAVATFGTITRGVQVYGTPTLLVVNKKGEVKTLTGLQDPYTIASAIRESRKH
jgi:hypothetical protein